MVAHGRAAEVVFLAILLIWAMGACFPASGPVIENTTYESPPAPPREEKLLHKFEAAGDQVTRPFDAPDRWEIRWTFSGKSHHSITTYFADGTYGDLLLNESGRPVQGSAFHPKGGTFYLDISSTDPYVIEIWQLI